MARRFLIGLAATLGWIGLLIQFPLSIAHSRAQGMTLIGAVITYLSFFTILTNLLIAVALTASFWPKSRVGSFFLRPAVTSALTAYIATVGIVYSLLLRSLWNPEGLQKTADILLHDAVPVMFVAIWFFLFEKARLPWRSVLGWLLYPLGYFCFALVRGATTGLYPYPFIDVGQIGYSSALGNAAVMLAAFAFLCMTLVAIGRWTQRHSSDYKPRREIG